MFQGYCKGQSDNLPAVDSAMVAEYMGKTSDFVAAEIRGKKTARAGRESYGDNALGYVQILRENNICTVKAKVTPEHKVRSLSYRVTAVVDENEGSIISMKCEDCAASAGGCKHAVAFLLWLHRRSEEPARTSVTCYWKRSKLSCIGTQKKMITAEEMGKSLTAVPISEEERQLFFHSVMDSFKVNHPDSQLVRSNFNQDSFVSLHSLLIGFHSSSNSQNASDFVRYCSSNLVNVDLLAINKETEQQADSDLWHTMRYGRITASKLYETAHCHTKEGVLVETILGAYKMNENFAIARGRHLEREVRKEVEDRLKRKINKCGLFLRRDYPILGASPDGIDQEYVYEIKCPVNFKTLARYIVDCNGRRIPCNKHLAQMQLQMLMSGRRKGYFCVAMPDFEKNHVVDIIEVEYDKNVCMDLIQRAMKFWQENVFPLMYNSLF